MSALLNRGGGLVVLFVLLGGFVTAGTVRGAITFTANITHDQETPATPDEGSSGVGTFVLNDAQTRLTYFVQLTGLDLDGLQTPGNANDNVTRAHFHNAPPGVAGSIVYGIIDASASLRNDNNPNDLIINNAAGTISGAWDATEGNGTTLTAMLPALFAGNLYFNIHTTDHAGGEIRGQVLQVPEPGTFALAALGATAPLITRKRRRA
jgi:hypothetical protein